MKKKKKQIKKKSKLQKEKQTTQQSPRRFEPRGKWYRRQSPYIMSHANIAYQVI